MDIAIENNDNNFTIYDLKGGNVSKTLTRTETNKVLRTINEGLNARESENISATPLSDNISDTSNNASTVSDNGNTVSDNKSAASDGERFAISQKNEEQISNYQKRIDSWDGQTEGFSFVMGDTPTYLSEIEVSGKRVGKKQVRIDATKIKSIMNEHPEMTRDVIKNLPHLLNDPIVVLDSKTVSGRLVLLGEVYANNKPVMMALEINPSTRSGNSTYVDVIKVASAYTRSNTQNLINSSNIRFVNENKNRVNDWLKVNRLQLPLPNSQSDSGTISIPQSTEKSNSFSEKTSENSSENTKKTKYQLEAEEFDRLANKEIEGYKKLSEPNRAMIRKILRQAKARGMSEADALSLARVSAHSGVDIVIGKESCKRTGLDENGKTVTWYADGFYSERTGKIYVNPESTRNYSSLLVHEFLHASKSMTVGIKGAKKVYIRLLELAKSSMSKADIKAIEDKYKAAYGNKQQLIDEEIIAEYGETFAGEQFISSLLSDEPTLFEKILAHFRGASKDYAADPRLSREARRFYRLYKKMFDNLAAVKQNTNAVESANIRLSIPKNIDKLSSKSYNNEQTGGTENGKQGNSERQNARGTSKYEHTDVRSDVDGRRVVPISSDRKGSANSVGIGKEKEPKYSKIQVIRNNSKNIYNKPQNQTQEILKLHANTEGYDIVFFEQFEDSTIFFAVDNGTLLLNEAATEKDLVDILNEIKPIKRDVDYSKIAHISNDRWAKTLAWRPDAYITRMTIQQFLDMTTESYVDQRQINAFSTKISQNVGLEAIKNTSGEYIYLEIDFDNNAVVSHEGRHRLTAMLNAGIAYVDLMVIPTNATTFNSADNLRIKGQMNSKTYPLSVVRADYSKFEEAINAVFKKDDGNFRYALPEGLNVVKIYEPKSLIDTITDAAKGAPSGFKSAILKTQIHFTDQQAGIIKAGSAMGYKDADADVQAVRAASNRAQAMLSDKQAIRRGGKLVEVGDGLYNILAPIKKLGTQVWVDFQDFLFHRHNISRMSLEKRSVKCANEHE